jgi:2-polyprenyl-3-methyl-5-hydroxy-6-metoxy-1,4-benzoquinol methylase
VIGGDRDDPEILALQGTGIEFTVRTLGIDEAADEHLDLNMRGEHEAHYDLVLCSQVLEHVWDHEATFSNLAALVRPGGLL